MVNGTDADAIVDAFARLPTLMKPFWDVLSVPGKFPTKALESMSPHEIVVVTIALTLVAAGHSSRDDMQGFVTAVSAFARAAKATELPELAAELIEAAKALAPPPPSYRT